MRRDSMTEAGTTILSERHAALASILGQLQALEASLAPMPSPPVSGAAVVKAARRLNRAAGTLALLVLLDSAVEHYRGSFENPAMFLPVTVPPVAAALMAGTALGAPGRDRRLTRWWLRLTSFLGFAGVAFHAIDVQRNMGGWRNWNQNLLNGPPLPAPPSFTGLALAGLAALGLLKDHPDA